MRQRRRVFLCGRHRRIVLVQRAREALLGLAVGLAVTEIEQSDPKAPRAVGIAQSPCLAPAGTEGNQPFRNAQSIDFACIFSAFAQGKREAMSRLGQTFGRWELWRREEYSPMLSRS